VTTIGSLIEEGRSTLEAAGLFFGHGTDNALDEAAELVLYGAGRSHAEAPGVYALPVDSPAEQRIRELFRRRVEERLPAAYLTHRMWFAGLEFYVDSRVLVPRSPIAELVETGFEPWLDPASVRRVLDIGTGSGCIAIACAHAFPDALVDAADVSADALEVAKINVERYGLGHRVRPCRADVYEGLGAACYDLIVANPPYVSRAEMRALPQEYRHEPVLGLEAGDDGLDVVRRILSGASARLTDAGILVVEVGDSEERAVEAFPQLPFTWLEFERGGGGVFLLTAAELRAAGHDAR
jgi:ribosomal protein L3 glutamine methyltransferase